MRAGTSDIPNDTVIRCDRCGRKARFGRAQAWNVEVRAGVIAGFLCPACQTAEENAEAEINETTLDYGQDAFGRSVARPKARADD